MYTDTINHIETRSLTPSGIGIEIPAKEFLGLEPKYVLSLLKNKGFILIRNLNFTKKEFSDLYRQYGHAVEYTQSRSKVGYGYKDMLELNGDVDKIVTGRGKLPFHTDGGILRSNVDQIFLYGAQINHLRFKGATLLTDHVAAVSDMPAHLREILEMDTFEVRAVETGYYSGASPDGWFKINTFKDYGWTRSLLVYFPFDKEDEPSWETRIKGFTESETEKFFEELGVFLKSYKYTYTHYWKTGDLIIADNRRTLHEREAFKDENAERVLWRGQTSESSEIFLDNEVLLG